MFFAKQDFNDELVFWWFIDLWVKCLFDPFVQCEGSFLCAVGIASFKRFDHGFKFDGTVDEIIEGQSALPVAVTQDQSVECAVVHAVAGRVQGGAQFKRRKRTALITVVQFVRVFPRLYVDPEDLEFIGSKFARPIDV